MQELRRFYESLPVMMDGSAPISQRPQREGDKVSHPGVLHPDRSYKLNPRTRVRKESFGCVVQSLDRFTVRTYDSAVYDLLSTLRDGCQGTDLVRAGYAEATVVDDMLVEGVILDNAVHPTTSVDTATFYDFLSDQGLEFQTPVSADLEVTRRCARNCSYCAYGSGPNVATSSELSTEQWFSILDDLAANGVCLVEFTGGDIITRHDVAEIIYYADRLGLFFVLTSDLTALPDRFRAILPDLNNLVGLQTTVDGHTNNLHDLLRGAGGFEQMSGSVRTLVDAGVPVLGGMIVGSQNAHAVGDALSLCRDMGFSGVQVAALYPSGRAANLTRNVPDNATLASASITYAEHVFSGAISPTVSNFYNFESQFRDDEGSFNHMRDMVYMAQSGYDTIRISPQGTCYASIKYENTDLFEAGSAVDSSIVDIWKNSPALKKIRQYRAFQPNNHFRAVDLRYLPEFEESAYAAVAQMHDEQVSVGQ